jgi:uncharacterized membrane protein YcaP (DUF421 family)
VFFRSWDGLLRVVLSAALVYVLVVAVLRWIGARALAKMSAYDLIVSIALGSMVASIPLSTSISVVDGLAAIATFLALQELTRFLQARYRAAHHLVRERPHVVVWDGKLIEDRLKKLDASPDEVRAAVRQAGILSIDAVQAVVLENDGAWSVMQRGEETDPEKMSALDGLDIPGRGPVKTDAATERSRPTPEHSQRPPTSSAASQI